MSAELFDLRAKVTLQTHLALQAYAMTHGLDQSEVVRDILHAWAVRQIHAASLLQASLRREGMTAAAEGIAGKTRES